MLPATITRIQQAFKEIKHMAIDTWQEECRFAARRAMKEVLESRMHNAVDVRAAGLCRDIGDSSRQGQEYEKNPHPLTHRLITPMR